MLRKNAKPTSERGFVIDRTNKQMHIKSVSFLSSSKQTNKCALKNISFFVIYASLTSNISGTKQNIKNLVGNLFGNG